DDFVGHLADVVTPSEMQDRCTRCRTTSEDRALRANHTAGRQTSEPAEDWGSTVSWLSTAVATAERYGARHQLHAVARQSPSVPRRKAPAPPRPVPAHHSSSRKEIVDIP